MWSISFRCQLWASTLALWKVNKKGWEKFTYCCHSSEEIQEAYSNLSFTQSFSSNSYSRSQPLRGCQVPRCSDPSPVEARFDSSSWRMVWKVVVYHPALQLSGVLWPLPSQIEESCSFWNWDEHCNCVFTCDDGIQIERCHGAGRLWLTEEGEGALLHHLLRMVWYFSVARRECYDIFFFVLDPSRISMFLRSESLGCQFYCLSWNLPWTDRFWHCF